MNSLLLALIEAGILSPADAERIERQLDPDAARLYSERLLGESFQRGLTLQQRRVLELVTDTQGNPTAAQQLTRLWAGEDDLLWLSVQDDLRSVAIDRAVAASIGNLAGPDMWMVVNENVLEWLDGYYLSPDAGDFGSIPNLNKTAQTAFGNAFRDWQRGELAKAGYQDGLPQLIRSLESVFGASRAERIAITEVSRVFAEAELHAARVNPFVTSLLWEASVDERVCPICGPRHGTVVGKESDGFAVATDSIIGYPPAHVRCRCRLTSLTQPALEALRAEGFVHA